MQIFKANKIKIITQFLAGCMLITLAIMINLDDYINILERFTVKSTSYLVIAGLGLIFISIVSFFKKKIILDKNEIIIDHMFYLNKINISDIKNIEKVFIPKKSFLYKDKFKYVINTYTDTHPIFSEDFVDLDHFAKEVNYLIKNKTS